MVLLSFSKNITGQETHDCQFKKCLSLYTAFSIKVVPEQSGKIEYAERERSTC